MELKKVENYDTGYALKESNNNEVCISKKLIIAGGIATALIGGTVALTSCDSITYDGNMMVESELSSNIVSSSDNPLTYDGDMTCEVSE